MTNAISPIFDFTVLDDFAFAAERGRRYEHLDLVFVAREIGPILELARLAENRLMPALGTVPWLTLDGLTPMVRALNSGRVRWVCPQYHLTGFLRMSPSFPQDATIWTRFCLTAQEAAKAAGFPKPTAAQCIAAIRELHTNIYEHSQAPDTGVVAFQAHPGRFEFVVSDGGIGALESLRNREEYGSLRDHGRALRLTLTDGISRFGSKSGRGLGFRPLFVGLANLNGSLRFRSGDHALLIDGHNPSLMNAHVAQKPTLRGFLVSVSCDTCAHTMLNTKQPASLAAS